MQLPVEKEWHTFADILQWDESERVELIDGGVIMMPPPTTAHQLISGELYRQLANYLEGKKCLAIPAPFAVRLFDKGGNALENVDTMVQPDISVVCDPNKLDDRGCKGAPDMVIEVLSPSTLRQDRLVKLDLYQRAGVREYWIVSPAEKIVEVLLLENGNLRPHEIYDETGIAKVNVLDGCFIELAKVFRS